MLKKFFAPLVITVVIILNLTLGFTRLSTYSAVDEPYWTYGRISKFWTAIDQGKWRSTDINDKPGITVAILSGFGLLKYDPMLYKSLREEPKTAQQLSDMDNINFYFRLPVFLFALLGMVFFYIFLKKLFNKTVAIFGFLFISLSPIIFGISLIINPDSLLWIFLPLSLLSYFIFEKDKQPKYLWLAGTFLGLSLLTKYVANILYVFFFVLPFLDYIFAKEKPSLTAYLKKSLINYLVLVAVSMLVFYVLYPATWAHPNTLLKGTFMSKVFVKAWPLFAGLITLILADVYLLKNKISIASLNFFSQYKRWLINIALGLFFILIVIVFANTYTGMKLYDFEGILASPKGLGANSFFQSYSGGILADTYSLIFGISPLALLAFIYALYWSTKKANLYKRGTKIVFYLAIFILIYYLGSTVNDVAATVRYQIALYPLAFVIAAIGLEQILLWLQKTKIKKYFPTKAAIILTGLILAVSIVGIRPFYFTYASSLLPQEYLLNTKDMGDGSYEAAAYLNSIPNAHDLTIWSDKGAVCAEFVGNCKIGFNPKEIRDVRFDYLVTSAGRQGRTMKLSKTLNDFIDFHKAYTIENDNTKKIIIGGRSDNFVKITSSQFILKTED